MADADVFGLIGKELQIANRVVARVAVKVMYNYVGFEIAA